MELIPLFSGSSGNAIFVEAGSARLLIDAGKPARTIDAALSLAGVDPAALTALLVTHEHTDHISGVGVLSRRYDLPIYANAATWQAMLPQIGGIAPKNIRVFETGRDFFIGSAAVTPFATPHDAAESVGYRISAHGRTAAVMTDIGHMDARLLSFAAGADALLIEANHDPELVKSSGYPYVLKRRILSDSGHLSNEACGKALCALYAAGLRSAILGHLSRENNFESLALETVRQELRAEDIPDDGFALCVAHRDRITGRFSVEDRD